MNARGALFAGAVLLAMAHYAAAQAPSANRAAPPVDADANAYRALAAGNQKELSRWQAAGGDAARYAKENPDAIYDAMRDERDVRVLAFVLESGANPNAQRAANFKGTPIFTNVSDRDKIALLIRYGADLNVRDQSGYTPLSYALFAPSAEFKVPAYPRPDQKVRIYAKVDVVRFLLASGAEINGNLGGWGHAGGLGLARREDKDVIDLLIERGATLKDPGPRSFDITNTRTNRGPLAMAMELERDDLALALLRRDGKIAPNDGLALLDAARRGYSETALAILNAGADPNAADAQGATPLGWALRRKDTILAAALQKAGASPSARPYKPKIDARNLDAFGIETANDIDDVALFDPYRFYPAEMPPGAKIAFAFYGNGLGEFEAVKCERAVGFRLVARQNEAGSILVGICASEAKRVRDAVRWAKVALAQMTNAVAHSAPKPEALKDLGWDWRSAPHEGGWQGYSFPLIAAGHGIVAINTAVLLNDKGDRAVIVQADLSGLCDPGNLSRTRFRSPLCDDPAKALTDVALAVARRP
jgi:ankyrin repeat protein